MKEKRDLSIFIKAQNDEFEKIKNALIEKKKISNQICYVFPILKGIETSIMSNFYGLNNLDEAKEYYKNIFLRKNIKELVKIILSYDKNTSLRTVFSYTDLQRFYSSMTLFYLATKEKVFKQAIWRYFYGILDDYTIQNLKNML